MAADYQTEHAVLITASPQKVWDVLTSPTAGPDWRNADFATDWKVGSSFDIAAHIGSKTYRDKGRVLAADPPRRLSYAYWSRVAGLDDGPDNWSVIDMRLTPDGEGTQLTVTQQVPPSPVRQVRGETIGPESGLRHVAFYWRTTLLIIKRIAEAR